MRVRKEKLVEVKKIEREEFKYKVMREEFKLRSRRKSM
jgi:hypothetical protein